MREAGADTSGNEPIDGLLREHAGDDTLLMFPPGEYLMTKQFRFTGYDNFGLVGNDATIVPGSIEEMDGRIATKGTFSGPTRLFRLGVSYAPGDRLLFEGFDFDFTAKNSGFRVIEAYVKKDMLVRDIDVVGKHDIGSFGPALFSVTDPDGISRVQGFRAPDGGEYTENTIGGIESGPTGILIPQSHKGKLWLENCELGGFPDQGVYASSTDGRVIVKGGTFRNSASAQIRLMASYSYIMDATVIVDDAHEGHNQRGIRLDSGKHLWVHNTDVRLEDPNGHGIYIYDDTTDARIQNSRIYVGDGEASYGIVIQNDTGPVDIYDVDIQFEGSGNPIFIDGNDTEDDARVHLLRTKISGDGPGNNGRNAIRSYRANCEFEDVEIRMTGDDYRRALEVQGDNCLVDGGVYEATHHAIVNVADGTRLRNVTTRSYSGFPSIKLYDGYSDVTVTDSTVYDGYFDKGTKNLSFDGVEFPDS